MAATIRAHASKDTAEAAFAPPRANMVLAASATAFERPHCVPAVVRERRTPDLCDRLIPSAAWGARGWIAARSTAAWRRRRAAPPPSEQISGWRCRPA